MNPSILNNEKKEKAETEKEKIHIELIKLYINIELKVKNNVSIIIYGLVSKYNSRNFRKKN